MNLHEQLKSCGRPAVFPHRPHLTEHGNIHVAMAMSAAGEGGNDTHESDQNIFQQQILIYINSSYSTNI